MNGGRAFTRINVSLISCTEKANLINVNNSLGIVRLCNTISNFKLCQFHVTIDFKLLLHFHNFGCFQFGKLFVLYLCVLDCSLFELFNVVFQGSSATVLIYNQLAFHLHTTTCRCLVASTNVFKHPGCKQT